MENRSPKNNEVEEGRWTLQVCLGTVMGPTGPEARVPFLPWSQPPSIHEALSGEELRKALQPGAVQVGREVG